MRKLSTKILNAVKAYFKRVRDLQDEVIKFNNDLEKEMYKDKK